MVDLLDQCRINRTCSCSQGPMSATAGSDTKLPLAAEGRTSWASFWQRWKYVCQTNTPLMTNINCRATNSWWNLLIFHCHLQPEMFPTQEKAPKKAAGCQSELDPVPCPVGRPSQLIFHEVVPFPPNQAIKRQPHKMWTTRYFLIIFWEFDQLWSGLISFDQLWSVGNCASAQVLSEQLQVAMENLSLPLTPQALPILAGHTSTVTVTPQARYTRLYSRHLPTQKNFCDKNTMKTTKKEVKIDKSISISFE